MDNYDKCILKNGMTIFSKLMNVSYVNLRADRELP